MNPIQPIAVIPALASCLAHAGDVPSSTTAEVVVRKMVEMDKVRASSLRRYVSERRYIVENRKFSKHAEVTVRESYAPPGKKELNIVSETGSPLVRRSVIDKLIEAELDAARDANRDQTHITSENYTFRLTGGNRSMVIRVSFSK